VRFVNVAVPADAATPADAWLPPSVPADALTVTVAALDTVFPYASDTRAAGCVENVEPEAPATGCVTMSSFVAEPALTVTDNRFAPVVVSEPCVATIVADSALNNTMDAVATPFVNVNEVADPNAVPATVGAVAGLEETDAPVKVTAFAPEYVVSVLPFASSAVTVIV